MTQAYGSERMPEISSLMAQPAPERFDGAKAWSELPADVQAEIGAIALEIAATDHLFEKSRQEVLPELYERVAKVAFRQLDRALLDAVDEALPDNAFLATDGQLPRLPALLGGVCSVCSCSQNDACDEGCGWASEDLCTACVEGGHDHG